MSLRISLRKEHFPWYPASFTLQSKPILFEGKKLFQFVFYFALLGMSTTKWIWRDSFTVHGNAQYAHMPVWKENIGKTDRNDLMSFLGYKIVKYDTIQFNNISWPLINIMKHHVSEIIHSWKKKKKGSNISSPAYFDQGCFAFMFDTGLGRISVKMLKFCL